MYERIDLPNLRWLMFAQAAVILPHASYLPGWLLVMVACFTGWRWASFHGYVRLPGAPFRAFLLLGCIGLFLVTYRGRFSVEAAVAFFALAYALKILEVRARRDLYLFIFLSFFLLAMKFLFDQSLAVTLYVLGAVWICFVGLARVVAPAGGASVALRVGSIMLQAMPLMFVAYMLFPRIAPLWHVPIKSSQALTGISDRVNPGDIAELAQSGKRAFRVSFENQAPSQQELYWRGLVLDTYHQGEWRDSTVGVWHQADSRGTDFSALDGYSYEIIQEPTGKPWGFALDRPVRVEGDYSVTSDGLIRFKNDLLHPVRYRLATRVKSAGDYLSPQDWQRYTALPPADNPATRAWVQGLQDQYQTPEALAERLMSWFREQPFFYTLRPQRLRGNQIDQFLFDTKSGFCAHYASAFAFAMRSAGVPARMVVGYQGGEWNRDGGYLMVHQYDAHAWVELWFDGRGWVRFDPTAMVAPERILQGIREATAEEGSFLEQSPLALGRYQNLRVAQWLRLRLDELNYNWQRWVVQYDEKSQLDLFRRWYEQVSLQTLGIWLLGLGLGAMAIILLVILRQERGPELDPAARLFRYFERHLAKCGVERMNGETPAALARRAAQRFPGAELDLLQVSQLLEEILYGKGNVDRSDVQQLKKLIRRLPMKKRNVHRAARPA